MKTSPSYRYGPTPGPGRPALTKWGELLGTAECPASHPTKERHIGVKWPKWFPLHDPAFRWGLLNPFGPPPPWWSPERREAYFAEHGIPWRS